MPRRRRARRRGRLRRLRGARAARAYYGASSPTGLGLAGLDDPGLVGEDDCLHAVTQLELGQDVRDVGLHGRLAEEELAGDLGVRAPPGHLLQDFDLPRRELLELWRSWASPAGWPPD